MTPLPAAPSALRVAVFTALNNAAQGGYDHHGDALSDSQVAFSLCVHDADCERLSITEAGSQDPGDLEQSEAHIEAATALIVPHVADWRLARSRGLVLPVVEEGEVPGTVEETSWGAVVTESRWPALDECLDIISHDGGAGAGHSSYAVPVGWTDAMCARLEVALAALSPEERETLAIGEDGEQDTLACRSAELQIALALFRDFSEA